MARRDHIALFLLLLCFSISIAAQGLDSQKQRGFNLFSNQKQDKNHQSVRVQGGRSDFTNILGQQQLIDTDMTCQGCKLTLFAVKALISNKFIMDIGKTIVAEKFCPLLVVNTTVCKGGVDTMASPLLDAIRNAVLDPEYFCENTLILCHDGDYQMFHAEDYTNKILASKPAFLKENNYLNQQYASIANQNNRNTIKAVLVTDPHVDFQYTVRADKDCNNYLCCRPDSGFPTEWERQASEWGEYKCDTAPKTLRAMFIYIRDVIKPDVIFWTGDNSPHSIWENDEAEVIEATLNMTLMIKEVLGNSTITIIPIQGNHDFYPSNIQDFTVGEGISELVSYGKIWMEQGWMSDKEFATYRKYGYYSKDLTLKNGKKVPNTKVIAINTMTCYYLNFELLKSRYDPGEELSWLEKELATIEEANGSAIIIGHIPPIFQQCNHGWGIRYQSLVERYQHIIKFGLFGHHHKEAIQVVTSPKNSRQRIGMNLIGGSATSFWKLNPSFNEISIDDQLMIPLSVQTHFFNISQGSLNPGKAKWGLLYNLKSFYNLLDMSPDEIYRGIAQRVLNEEMIAKAYYWNKYKQADGSDAKTCKEFCRLKLFCEIAHPEQFEYNNCMGQPNYDFINEPSQAIMSLFTSEWSKRLTQYE